MCDDFCMCNYSESIDSVLSLGGGGGGGGMSGLRVVLCTSLSSSATDGILPLRKESRAS